jgi:hypothetical protein
LILLIFHSCEKEPVFDHEYLISHTLVRTLTAEQAKTNIRIFEAAHPEIGVVADNISSGVRVYRISYRSEFRGEEITLSGLVSFPDIGGSYPVLSFQNGTNTCHSNAPSQNPGNMLYTLLYSNSGNGLIISIPDYIGFGESDDILHPYYHTESNNRVIRDMLKAVKELADYSDNSNPDGSLYLMGYSQGGWATMSVLKDIESNPLDGYELASVSCGAGGYNLIEFTDQLLELDSFPNPFYLPYFIESRRRLGWIIDDLDVFFREPYAGNIPSLFDGSLCNDILNSRFTTKIDELLTEDLINNFDDPASFLSLKSELNNCRVDPWNVRTPLLIAHSRGDLSVFFTQSENLYNGMLDAGTPEDRIQFMEMEDHLHNDAVLPWGIETLLWFLDL